MKKILFISFFLVQVLVAEINNVLLVGNNWCPQHCMNNPQSPGYLVELTQAALKAVNVESQMTFRPWLRAIKVVRQGTYDALLTPSQSEETDLIRHKIPLATQRFCFYTKNTKSIKLKRLYDFQNRSIAFTKGNNLGNDFMRFISHKPNKVDVTTIVSSNEEFAPRIFSILLKERVDAIAITEDFADYYLGINPSIKKDVRKQYCTEEENLHIGLSAVDKRRSLIIAKYIDKGLIKIKKNGEYYRILNKYFLNY